MKYEFWKFVEAWVQTQSINIQNNEHNQKQLTTA